MFTQSLGEALEAAELWVKLEPESSEARKSLAPLLLAFGRAPEAEQHYKKFIALSANKPDRGFSQISAQLSRDKNNIAALSVMDKLLAKNKSLPHAWLAHAQLVMHQVKLKLALSSVDHALDLKGHWAPAVVLRAQIISLQGNRQAALDYLEDERGDELENDEIEIDAEADMDTEIEEYVPVEMEEEVIDETEIFTIFESAPEFVGGDAALYKYLNKVIYPTMAQESGVQGRVYVTFVVEIDGSITDVRILRGIGGGCDEEAVRVMGHIR